MEQSIRERVEKKEYDQITSSKEFAKLTDDLQAVSKDKHLRVRYSHQVIPERGLVVNRRRKSANKENAT